MLRDTFAPFLLHSLGYGRRDALVVSFGTSNLLIERIGLTGESQQRLQTTRIDCADQAAETGTHSTLTSLLHQLEQAVRNERSISLVMLPNTLADWGANFGRSAQSDLIDTLARSVKPGTQMLVLTSNLLEKKGLTKDFWTRLRSGRRTIFGTRVLLQESGLTVESEHAVLPTLEFPKCLVSLQRKPAKNFFLKQLLANKKHSFALIWWLRRLLFPLLLPRHTQAAYLVSART